jgi:hypothetical protein
MTVEPNYKYADTDRNKSPRFVPSDPQAVEQGNGCSEGTSNLNKHLEEADQKGTLPRLPLGALKSIGEIEQTTRTALANSVPKNFPFPSEPLNSLTLNVPRLTEIMLASAAETFGIG